MAVKEGRTSSNEASTGRETNFMRAGTEYLRSPSQLAGTAEQAKNDDKHGKAAKKMYRMKEAQVAVDGFRPQTEDAMEREFEDFSVAEVKVADPRKVVAKVHVGNGEYVHFIAFRHKGEKRWDVRYAPYKTEPDPLYDSADADDYEELPSDAGLMDIIVDPKACHREMLNQSCTLL